MKLGVMTVLLGNLSLDDTLKYLKSLGVQRSPPCDAQFLQSSERL